MVMKILKVILLQLVIFSQYLTENGTPLLCPLLALCEILVEPLRRQANELCLVMSYSEEALTDALSLSIAAMLH